MCWPPSGVVTSTTPQNRTRSSRFHPWLRAFGAVLGGWVLAFGFATLVSAVSLLAGAGFEDAEHGSVILALLVFLCTLIWGAWVPRLRWLWGATIGPGALMLATGWWIQHQWLPL